MNLVALDAVCEIIAGQSPPSSTYNNTKDGVPFFQGKADFGVLYPVTRMWCSEPRKMSLPNDILISVRAPVGPTNINSVKACIGRGLSAIRCSDKIEQKFLLHFLRFNEHKIADKGTGSTFKAITQKELKAIQVPLPPLAEQQKIAAILDAADSLRQKDRRLIDHYTNLSQSLFLEMFGDYFNNKSCYREILEVSTFIDYRGKTPERTNTGVPLISAKCVRAGYFDKSRLDFITHDVYKKAMTRGFPKIGDVLFTTEGATMGYTCRIPEGLDKFAVGQRLITLQPNHLYNSIALDFVLNSGEIQVAIFKQATGSAVKGIRSAKFAKILIPVPPINVQNQFSERIKLIEAQKQQAQASLVKSEALFNSLLQRAFTGELTEHLAA